MTTLTCTFNSNQHTQLTSLPGGSLVSQSPSLLSHFLYVFFSHIRIKPVCYGGHHLDFYPKDSREKP